jgi:hypothetical protein
MVRELLSMLGMFCVDMRGPVTKQRHADALTIFDYAIG